MMNLIFAKIKGEIRRQEALKMVRDFDSTNTKNDWIAYICAYAGRATDKCLRNEKEGQSFEENLIKVAALCVSALIEERKRRS